MKLLFSRVKKGLKIELARKAFIIFVKSIKKALSGMFTLFVGQ
jgi:hypothetical protein